MQTVAESITFNIGAKEGDPGTEWINKLREEIGAFENAEDFRDMHIICIENKSDNHKLQDFYGVTLALNVLREKAKAKILLYHVNPLSYITHQKPEIGLVLKHDNVFILEAPFTMEMLQNVFTSPKPVIETSYAITDEMGKYLSRLFHDLKYVKGWDESPVPAEDGRFVKIMQLAKSYFPTLKEKSDAEIVTFLKETKVDRPLVMKGRYLEGVYCDVEGTLLVDGKLNEKVVKALSYYWSEKKKITIWTDGDVDDIFTKLRMLGVPHSIVSKHDYAGATAEIVIDDMDEFSFAATTKIAAGEFIRVSDIQ